MPRGDLLGIYLLEPFIIGAVEDGQTFERGQVLLGEYDSTRAASEEGGDAVEDRRILEHHRRQLELTLGVGPDVDEFALQPTDEDHPELERQVADQVAQGSPVRDGEAERLLGDDHDELLGWLGNERHVPSLPDRV